MKLDHDRVADWPPAIVALLVDAGFMAQWPFEMPRRVVRMINNDGWKTTISAAQLLAGGVYIETSRVPE